MRTLSTDAITLLAGKYAIEPIVLVEISWVDGSSVLYSDRTVESDQVHGNIIELSPFDDSQTFDGEGANTSVTITLSDTDGTIKNIFNNLDIHKRPVKLWQWFNGFNITDKFLLSSGVIHSPIVWDEGKRTLSFAVLSRLESWEIGFDATEGYFPSIPHELIGKPWPMVFGTVTHSPALQMQDIPTGFLLQPFGIPDPNIPVQLAKLNSHLSQLKQAAATCFLDAALACATFEFNDPTAMERGMLGDPSADCNNLPEVQQFNQQAIQFQNEANQENQSIISLSVTYGQQSQWWNPPTIYVTTNITQPYSGQLRIGNQLFHGVFEPFGSPQPSRITDKNPILFDPNAGLNVDGTPKQSLVQKAGFQFYNVGTQVTIAGPYPLYYMASIVPGTITGVFAYRSWNGKRQLAPVPSSYYSITNKSFGAVTAYGLTLNMPLSTRAFLQNLQTEVWENDFGNNLPPHIVNQVDWEDDLYVTFASSVGPNPVDIMTYLIETYSDLAIDSASFAATKTSLTSYPMNFMIAARPQLIDILNELAYQCRCAIWIKDDTFFLKYLPLQVAAVDTLTEADIVPGSLKVTTSNTESLCTKYIATFRPDYSPEYEVPVQIILRYNIRKYGIHSEQHDYFAYNNYFLVEKSATFWLIRKSLTWKYIECKVLMHKINLETFDTVSLNFSHPYVAIGNVPGLIESAVYDSADNTIEMKIWVPVRAGEMKQFELAWPAGASETDLWPPYRDLQAGAAGGINGTTSGILPLANSTTYQINRDYSAQPEAGFNLYDYQTVPYYQPPLGTPYYTPDAPFIPLDWGKRKPSDNGDIVTTNEAKRTSNAAPIDTPKFAYDFLQPQDPNIPPLRLGTDTWPCVIQGYVGNIQINGQTYQQYKATVYKGGIGNQGTTMGAIFQLQLDLNDRIPDGTWTHVNVVRWSEKKNSDGSSTSTSTSAGPDGSAASPSRPDADAPGTAATNQNYFTQSTIQLPVWLM